SFVSGDFFLIPASGSGSIGPRDGQAIILRTTIP
ncbi:MAG: hypothetical protein ACI9NC_005045, partial [Verrucomicrobiales bacterium]